MHSSAFIISVCCNIKNASCIVSTTTRSCETYCTFSEFWKQTHSSRHVVWTTTIQRRLVERLGGKTLNSVSKNDRNRVWSTKENESESAMIHLTNEKALHRIFLEVLMKRGGRCELFIYGEPCLFLILFFHPIIMRIAMVLKYFRWSVYAKLKLAAPTSIS